MPIYETVFIARQDLGDAQVKAITESCEKIIKDAKGRVFRESLWVFPSKFG
jgi:ribosomal protein S6